MTEIESKLILIVNVLFNLVIFLFAWILIQGVDFDKIVRNAARKRGASDDE